MEGSPLDGRWQADLPLLRSVHPLRPQQVTVMLLGAACGKVHHKLLALPACHQRAAGGDPEGLLREMGDDSGLHRHQAAG